jgi:hypothetical protein
VGIDDEVLLTVALVHLTLPTSARLAGLGRLYSEREAGWKGAARL